MGRVRGICTALVIGTKPRFRTQAHWVSSISHDLCCFRYALQRAARQDTFVPYIADQTALKHRQVPEIAMHDVMTLLGTLSCTLYPLSVLDLGY